MVPNDSDEDLGARLHSALGASLESERVDVEALLTGSRRRARQLRSQRIGVAAVAAVLVIGLPAGYEVLRPTSGINGPPAALLPSSQPKSGAGKNDVSKPPISKPQPPIADQLAVTPAELPSGLVPGQASALTAVAIVDGQVCTQATAAISRPAARRRWLWSTAGSSTTGPRVTLTVTRWAPGAGSARLGDLSTDTGVCRWRQPQITVGFTAAQADQSWSGGSVQASDQGRWYSGRAVVRVGDWVAGVEVQQQEGGLPTALALAQKLAGDEARRFAAAQPG